MTDVNIYGLNECKKNAYTYKPLVIPPKPFRLFFGNFNYYLNIIDKNGNVKYEESSKEGEE